MAEKLFYIEAVRFGKKRGSVIPCTAFVNKEDAESYIIKNTKKNFDNGYTLRVVCK